MNITFIFYVLAVLNTPQLGFDSLSQPYYIPPIIQSQGYPEIEFFMKKAESWICHRTGRWVSYISNSVIRKAASGRTEPLK